MLKINEDGAHITLVAQSAPKDDAMFWFGATLFIGAIAVAIAMTLLSERLAIGALALLVIGSFVFNWLRMRRKKTTNTTITSGVLQIRSGMFVHSQLGKNEPIYIQPNDVIRIEGDALIISKGDGVIKCQVSGFESPKEAQVMQSILQGRQFERRNANITMQSN